jgi:hypothetical protein
MALHTAGLVVATEMRLARSGADRVPSRLPAALLLVGEPGIGETRLLAELAVRADARCNRSTVPINE